VQSAAAQFHRLHAKVRPILGTCLCGLSASVAAVGFQLAINWLYRHTFVAAAARGHFLLVSFAVIVAHRWLSAGC
jgi:hypothetical protein